MRKKVTGLYIGLNIESPCNY